MWVCGWEFLIVCHHPSTFGGQRHCGSGDMFLISHVISKDHVLKGLCDFIGGSSSWWVARPSSLTAISNVVVEIMFLVLEEQDSTFSLNSTITISLKHMAHGTSYSHTRNFTVNRTLMKDICECVQILSRSSLILVSGVLGNKWWNMRKETFPRPSKNTVEKKKSRTTIVFALRANAIKKQK